jgi:hypothetical protein
MILCFKVQAKNNMKIITKITATFETVIFVMYEPFGFDITIK